MADIHTQREYEQYQRTVEKFINREQIELLSTTTYNGEPWFSWRACEMCGSPLGGMRVYLRATHTPTKQDFTYSICNDCEYYVEYGRLDDLTMMEIRHSEE